MDLAAPPAAQAKPSPGAPGPRRGRALPGWLALLDRPLTSYYLILGITLLLITLGLIMVLSTSSAVALDSGGSTYAGFQKQLLGVAVGLPLMWVAAKSSPTLFRAAAYPLMGISILGLLLVLAVGVEASGATRWLQVGPFQVQPSEFAKLAFVLWGADLLARKEKLGQLKDWRQLLLPLLPGAALLCMLVMLGDDLGTTFLLLVIFLALLWVIGTPGRMFIGILAIMGFVMIILVIVAPYRLERITGFLHPQAHPSAAGYQLKQGTYALGSGGLFGVGFGQGRQQYGFLPFPYSDFIASNIGEEWGFLGLAAVTLAFAAYALLGFRIARQARSPFLQLVAVGLTFVTVITAYLHVGVVIGLLPTTGLTLPFVSYGRSNIVLTMFLTGVLVNIGSTKERVIGSGATDPLALPAT